MLEHFRTRRYTSNRPVWHSYSARGWARPRGEAWHERGGNRLHMMTLLINTPSHFKAETCCDTLLRNPVLQFRPEKFWVLWIRFELLLHVPVRRAYEVSEERGEK